MSDAISDLLNLMRVRSTAYIAKNLKAPWGIHIAEHSDLARFHMVISGSTWVGMPDGSQAHKLNVGDIAIIPQGKAHDYFCDRAPPRRDTKAYPTQKSNPRFELFDKESEDTHLLCGFFEISEQTPDAVTANLPDILIGRRDDPALAKKFVLIADLAIEEISNSETPSQATLNRLTEMLCVYTIQAWFDRSLPENPQLRAIADPRTKLVLERIHNDPLAPWTVEGLAKIHGQSKTAFTSHFQLAMGVSPMKYVRQWRIKQACEMLSAGALSLDEIAFKVGYSDTNAFNRAFRREIGSSPGSFRKSG